MIWREKRILLIILGVLLAANTLFFFTYRVQYQSRLRALAERQQAAEEKLQQTRNVRLAAERQMTAFRNVQRELQTIYDDRWSTQEQRLTPLILEVKRLTLASQLVPKTTTYTHVETTKEQAGGNDVTTVGIAFNVQGNYQQIRRLINLLELSNQFVIIDGLSLAGGTGAKDESLSIRIKTLFRNTPPAAPVPANQEM